jgi:hypothetical protein
LLPATNLCYPTSQRSEDFKFAYVQEVYITHLSILFKNISEAAIGKGNEKGDFVQAISA